MIRGSFRLLPSVDGRRRQGFLAKQIMPRRSTCEFQVASAVNQLLICFARNAQCPANLVQSFASMLVGHLERVRAMTGFRGRWPGTAIVFAGLDGSDDIAIPIVEREEFHAPITHIALNRIKPPLVVRSRKCSVQAFPLSVVVH